MKKYNVISKWLTLAVLGAVITGCVLEPMQSDNPVVIKGAPDWVNKGSYFNGVKDARLFYGVSSANPQGDFALQKSIADDRAHAEVVRVLVTFLDVVAYEFLQASRNSDSSVSEEMIYRHIEDAAIRRVNEGVITQIDEAISRQFKEGVSSQFKEDLVRKVKDSAHREIKEAISYQIEISRNLEEIISRQFKDAVLRQMKTTASAHLVKARIIGNWHDPRTNAIWSISELELKNIKNTMTGIADINAELKQFVEINADNIFDRIIRDRNNMNPFAPR